METGVRQGLAEVADISTVSPRVARALRGAAALMLPLLPAVASGCASGLWADALGVGVLVGLCTLLVAYGLETRDLPFHLMPTAAVVARLGSVGSGVALAYLVALPLSPLEVEPLVVGLAAGWAAVPVAILFEAGVARWATTRAAVIGSAGLLRALRGELALARDTTIEVAGRAEAGSEMGGGPDEKPLGWIEELPLMIAEKRLDLLIGGAQPSKARRSSRGPVERRVAEIVSHCCLELDVRYISVDELFEERFAHVPLGRVDATWFAHVLHPRFRSASPFLKRSTGVVAAILGTIVAAPVVAIAAIAIKLDDGGPVFFRQRRIGERGREFDVVKLRTMTAPPPGAEVDWSAQGQRVTRVGAVLRRLHVDELPQLWNVIRGEMALVGPRPERPELVAMLEQRLDFYGRRHLMRPGITGWAQVRCGYSGSLWGSVWKLSHDLFYLKRRSLLFDAMILVETLATPVRDARVARRVPDRLFVLEAIREEHEWTEPSTLDPDFVRARGSFERRPSPVPSTPRSGQPVATASER
jgi:lipopolysaccharide/colanic/teichoic acid biosynthesis glycosyltransferase